MAVLLLANMPSASAQQRAEKYSGYSAKSGAPTSEKAKKAAAKKIARKSAKARASAKARKVSIAKSSVSSRAKDRVVSAKPSTVSKRQAKAPRGTGSANAKKRATAITAKRETPATASRAAGKSGVTSVARKSSGAARGTGRSKGTGTIARTLAPVPPSVSTLKAEAISKRTEKPDFDGRKNAAVQSPAAPLAAPAGVSPTPATVVALSPTVAVRTATAASRRAGAPRPGPVATAAGLPMMLGALCSLLYLRRRESRDEEPEEVPHIDPVMALPSADVALEHQQIMDDLMQRAEPLFVGLRSASIRKDHEFILQHCTEDMATSMILDSVVADTPSEPRVEGLRAELVDLFEEVNRYVASVQYTADEQLGDRRPRQVKEVWHFVREPEAADWRLAGVEPA